MCISIQWYIRLLHNSFTMDTLTPAVQSVPKHLCAVNRLSMPHGSNFPINNRCIFTGIKQEIILSLNGKLRSNRLHSIYRLPYFPIEIIHVITIFVNIWSIRSQIPVNIHFAAHLHDRQRPARPIAI